MRQRTNLGLGGRNVSDLARPLHPDQRSFDADSAIARRQTKPATALYVRVMRSPFARF